MVVMDHRHDDSRFADELPGWDSRRCFVIYDGVVFESSRVMCIFDDSHTYPGQDFRAVGYELHCIGLLGNSIKHIPRWH